MECRLSLRSWEVGLRALHTGSSAMLRLICMVVANYWDSRPDRHGKAQVWMSHGDKVTDLPEGFSVTASTESAPVAAMENPVKTNLRGSISSRGYVYAKRRSFD